jgi:ABC-type polysaccharide/polyol phosphate export permease
MNAQKLIGLMVVTAVVVAAFVHGSMSLSDGMRLALHGWWVIWKIALILLAGGVLLFRRMRGAARPAASEACREDRRT